ncbi:thiolase family protein [Ottowia thiooxydans]|uniref:thiolase family protein n=1 Tax=Ottowia thiooxydans TaxID=219182 RepID=UPI0004912128|nr:thiolase family protein [Ottowia thiooxydans]
MEKAYICGVGMTPFARHPQRSMKDLAREAITNALADASVAQQDIQAVYCANSMAGIVTGQESIRGQVVLNAMGITGVPVVNVENACASGATAVHQAWMSVAAGLYDSVLVLGVEKLYHEDRLVSMRALASATDVELSSGQSQQSSFLAESSRRLANYMQDSGATLRHVAEVAAKSRRHASLNPLAHYRETYTVDEILASPVAAPPLTRLMCSPISDGAAAVVICSEKFRRERSLKVVRIAASVLRSGGTPGPLAGRSVDDAADAAYNMAGLGPEDISLAEVHDTTAASELMLYERLRFCKKNEAPAYVDEGGPSLGGRLPVNTSGGLIARGHPVGATGVAQICELTWQLRQQAGDRQVINPRAALAHNAGGTLAGESAATAIHILTI